MGDKTQLAAMTLAADTKRPVSVFVGAALALTGVSAIGVAVGGALGFITVGVLMLAGKI